MTTVIARVDAAGLVTVQDGGRVGFTEVGVPVSGALHRLRYLVSTALVTGRADPDIPALEVLVGALDLSFACETAVAVVGPARLSIDGRAAATGATVLVPSGGVLRLEATGPGPAYLAIAGWTVEQVLGSAATDTFSRLGPAPVRAGTVLRGSPSAAGRERIGAFHRSLPHEIGSLRLVAAGPTSAALAAASWTVTSVARSGVRLAGGPMPVLPEIASIPVLPGAVQLTPSGEAIVLGPDGGLTGGYPVVGVVASVDLDRVSTLVAGSSVGFRVVTTDEAADAHRQRLRFLTGCVTHPDHLP